MTQLKGGFNFELTEFGNVERQMNKQPEIADPGAPMMKIIVRDIDAVVAAAKKVNAPIITKGGAPVMVPTSIGNAKAIVMRDPDGYFVQAIQGTPAADSPEGPVIGAIMGLTVRDMDETLKYWNGLLGIELEADKSFSNDAADARSHGTAKGRLVPHGRRRDLRQQGADRDDRDQGRAAEAVRPARHRRQRLRHGDSRRPHPRPAGEDQGRRADACSRATASSSSGARRSAMCS